jgi:hypothetical protein
MRDLFMQGSGDAGSERENKCQGCLVQHLVTVRVHCGLRSAVMAFARLLP